jgi:hypothetical protein
MNDLYQFMAWVNFVGLTLLAWGAYRVYKKFFGGWM